MSRCGKSSDHPVILCGDLREGYRGSGRQAWEMGKEGLQGLAKKTVVRMCGG